MKTFSLKLTDEAEREVAELLATGNYVHQCDIFLEALALLYNKIFFESDADTVTSIASIGSIEEDTLNASPNGGFKVTITTKECEPEEKQPLESAYDRLNRVLGIYNGSYLS